MYQFAVHPAAPGIPEAEERRSESISRATSESKEESSSDKREDEEDLIQPVLERTHTNSTVRSSLSESRFAVLPEGITLDGWTAAEKRELNDHVRHMLHSRRSKFKRGMKGFWKYVRKRMYIRSSKSTTGPSMLMEAGSYGIPRHPVRHTDNAVWFSVGALPYWYVSG